MITAFEIKDELEGYVLVSVRFDSDIPDYPLELTLGNPDNMEGPWSKDLTVEEGLELFNKLRNIFEPCLKNI